MNALPSDAEYVNAFLRVRWEDKCTVMFGVAGFQISSGRELKTLFSEV